MNNVRLDPGNSAWFCEYNANTFAAISVKLIKWGQSFHSPWYLTYSVIKSPNPNLTITQVNTEPTQNEHMSKARNRQGLRKIFQALVRFIFQANSSKVCQMLSRRMKNWFHFTNIWDTVTNVVPSCSVYEVPSHESNLTLLAWLLPEIAYFSRQCRPPEE